jgi:hypothetical protein
MERKTDVVHVSRAGLCSTCQKDAWCRFPRKAKLPVMDCLEFDGEVLAHRIRRHRTGRAATERHGDAPGLCAWCDAEATCAFPRPPGGVWFCEEYR